MNGTRLLVTLLATLVGFLLPTKAQHLSPNIGEKVSTDDGIYIVSGTNLITNGDFSDGFNGWRAGDGTDLSSSNFEVQPTGGPDGSPCLHALSGAGSSTNKSIKTGWAIETGKTYLFQVWAYRTQSGMSSNTEYSRIYLSNSSTTTTTQIGTVSYKADTWTLTQIVFTADKPYLVANLSWLNAASSFTGFFLAEVTASTELATDKLKASIDEANSLLASTEEGTAKGQYTTDTRQTLKDAIATATSILSSATEQSQINEANTALQNAIAIYSNSKNPSFRTGVGYTICNVGAQLNLSTVSGKVQIKTPNNADSTQVFYFVRSDSGAGYHIHDANGTYIYKDSNSNWEMKSGMDIDLTSKDALFTIEDHDNYVLIRNANRSYMGTDGSSDGNSVYDDKGGSSNLHRWTLTRHTPTAALEALIAQAETLLNGTSVGTSYDEVPQSAYDELSEAIVTAREALATITSYEEATAATDALQQVISTFNASFNPLPNFADGQTYLVRHYGGNVLTTTDHNGNYNEEANCATITTVAESGAVQEQLMTFESATLDNEYYVRSVSTGKYLTRVGAYNTEWKVGNEGDTLIVRIEKISGKYLGLKFTASNTYLGTDATTSGSRVYSDKAASQNSYWTLKTFVTAQLDRTAYNEAVSTAEQLLKATVVGYKKGEYAQADYDAFSQLVASARSQANKATTQEELDAITTQLLTDIEAYKQKAHIEDLINRDLINAEIEKATATCENAVAGDLNGQYSAETIAALKQSISQAKTIADDATSTQAQIDEALEALQKAETEFAAQRVVIDYTALRNAIKEAQQAITDATPYKGNGAGKYPEEAFTALQQAIDAAQAVIMGHTLNQAGVDELSAQLQDAVTTFQSTRVPNDYSELQELVDKATELIAQAEAGQIAYDPDYLTDLKASLEKNGAALESTDQDVIDQAAKMLQRDILIFQLMVDGIDNVAIDRITATGAKVTIYDLNGRMVGHASRGTYIIRIVTNGTTLTRKAIVR